MLAVPAAASQFGHVPPTHNPTLVASCVQLVHQFGPSLCPVALTKMAMVTHMFAPDWTVWTMLLKSVR